MIHQLIQQHQCKSVLCLNGTLPDKSFFDSLSLPVFAADGAANHLVAQGVYPKLIIGDLDSVQQDIQRHHPTLHLPDQNSCDFEKSFNYLAKNDLLPPLILGGDGGFLDHILYNINLFVQYDALLYAPPIVAYTLNHGIHNIPTYADAKLSIMAIPDATVSSKGLKWELEQYPMSFPGQQSCFNRAKSHEVVLTVHQGQVFVLMYLESIKDAGI